MTTTVRFAYCLNIDSHYESLLAYECKEWSGLVYSFKIGQRQIIAGITAV